MPNGQNNLPELTSFSSELPASGGGFTLTPTPPVQITDEFLLAGDEVPEEEEGESLFPPPPGRGQEGAFEDDAVR